MAIECQSLNNYLIFFLHFTFSGILRCLENNYTGSDSFIIVAVDVYLIFLDISVV